MIVEMDIYIVGLFGICLSGKIVKSYSTILLHVD